MSYESFLKYVRECVPEIEVGNRTVASVLKNYYDTTAPRDRQQEQATAQLWADAYLAGRRSVQISSRKLTSGLARRLLKAEAMVAAADARKHPAGKR